MQITISDIGNSCRETYSTGNGKTCSETWGSCRGGSRIGDNTIRNAKAGRKRSDSSKHNLERLTYEPRGIDEIRRITPRIGIAVDLENAAG